MPTRKDLRVILGGTANDAQHRSDHDKLGSIAELLERVTKYRRLLADRPADEAAGLVTDMEDAIRALQRLQLNPHPEARLRAAEYRRLIAELDAEIATSLPNS